MGVVTIKAKCGTQFSVDEDLAGLFVGLSWGIDRKGYVKRTANIDGKAGVTLFIHRLVTAAKPGQIVDHIDCNTLNNTKENLRFVTPAQSAQNQRKRNCGASSVYRGVTWHAQMRKWQATIKANKKNYYLGIFETEHEAGHAYNKAAIGLHGEFARLNPVGESA